MNTVAQVYSIEQPARTSAVSVTANRWLLPAAAIMLVATLAAYNLTLYPRTWFDEGINLLAAKLLAQTGQYGLQTASGFSPFDIGLSTGPTVILPMAALFKVFGVGLAVGRLVPVAYIVLAAGGLYLTGVQLFGRAVGMVAVVAFASLTDAGPFANGRHALGEIAALAYLFLGTAAFVRARTSGADTFYALAGVLFGLVILTKNQLGLLVPVLVLLWPISRLTGGRFAFRHVVILLVMVAVPNVIWYAYQIVILGPAGFAAHLHELSAEASVVAVSPLRKAPAALDSLLSSGFFVWSGAGLLYMWLLALRERWWRDPERLILPLFATAWLGFFVAFTIGWTRYSVPALVPCSLFVAKLIVDLARRVAPSVARGGQTSLRSLLAEPLGTCALLVAAGALVSGVAVNAITIARAHDTSPQDFAALVRERVEVGAVVESSEWEIDFLTGSTYHHPPAALVLESVGTVFMNQAGSGAKAYRVPTTASYLIDGPFSRLSGVYRSELELNQFTPVATVGEYVLYRRDGAQQSNIISTPGGG